MGPSDIALLCVLLILLLFSAFFSSAETALTTTNKVRLRMLVEEGNKQAIILDKILGNSRKMLSTILIGNNIVNIAASSLTTIFMQSVFKILRSKSSDVCSMFSFIWLIRIICFYSFTVCHLSDDISFAAAVPAR